MLGDELGGLVQQLPRGLIAVTCIAGLLWVALMIFFAVIRPSRRRRAAEANALTSSALARLTPDAPSPYTAPPDLPDLDLLMDSHAAPEPAAAPKATSTHDLPPVAAIGAPRRLGSADVRLSDGSTTHAEEQMVVLRDPRDGKLMVQIGDVAYKSFAGAAKARETFKTLLHELGVSLNPNATGPLPAQPATTTRTMPAAAPPPPSPTGDGSLPGDLPRFNELRDEIKSRGAFRPHKVESPAIPELNIAGSIESYLQYKLQFAPEFQRRGIHVRPAPGGGVRIEADGRFFDAVSDVDDPDVQAFIRSAIEEWQSRQ
ncbi:MAG: hypothetical protein IT298_15920 [Chloroflexi bacterium]|nr:MAG: hypothetical protein UZ13_02676 [Chloroflexi bacterium OLB13]MBC6957607.1 hypothetical protein [Chloroflexota bacterium]MBV6437764.1 hypothetical protein [Anaerolineae bacterium]MDL1917374.1 hypothetical protein [Anaerolineae bacterium CFX4]MBW7880744.1 hypothetical protein [Anaerolineae bacterium]